MALDTTLDLTPVSEPNFDTITPGQFRTRIECDVPEVVTIEAFFTNTRRGSEIAPLSATKKGADCLVSQRMRYWKSGAWTLRPIQDTFNATYELPPNDFNETDFVYGNATGGRALDLVVRAATNLIYAALWGGPVGVGIVTAPGINSRGDLVMRKNVAAGASYASSETVYPPPPQGSDSPGLIEGTTAFPAQNVRLDNWFYTDRVQQADQGFYLRWLFPGVPMSTPDTLFNFYFGQYCLIVDGSGKATLAEYCQPRGGGAYRWKQRSQFQYCRAGQAVGNPHTMTIFPHKGPNGEKFIIFAGNNVDTAQGGAMGLLSSGSAGGTVHTDEFLYEANPLTRFNDVDDAPESVTKAAHIRLDVRQDMRPGFHVSKLIFRNFGGIIDSIHGLPDHSILSAADPIYGEKPFQVRVQATYPPSPSGALPSIDAVVNLDTVTEGSESISNPYVYLTFNGTGSGGIEGASYTTPILWSYEIYRPATNIIVNPGMFSLLASSASVSGIAGPDPRQEHGNVIAHDLLGTHTRLSRGKFAARVVMDYQEEPGGDIVPVVLSRGYALRPKFLKHGRTGAAFPDHKEYSFLISGIADRASAVSGRTIGYEHFDLDEFAPTVTDGPRAGSKPPWKVTDVIRFVLAQRGFVGPSIHPGGELTDDDSSQILIPDLPIRLWSGTSEKSQDHVYNPHTDPIDMCVTLARNYLGGYLIWDANAGPLDSSITEDEDDITPMGAWRLLQPPPPGATPVYNFVSSPTVEAEAGQFIPPHSPAAYASDATFIISSEEGYTIPPEINHVWVFTAPPTNETPGQRFERHLYNPKSYDVPGMSITSDPDSPHYLGFEQMRIVPCADLLNPADFVKTQLAVDFTARRIMDFAGRARKVLPISAPLVLITDAATSRKRPLRYYDPVTVNGVGGYYIRSVSPSITSPNHRAQYEVERLIPFSE